MSRLHLSLLAGVALVLAACDDAAAPKGEPGDLTVRAYIDRDASGTFTAGDLAVQGVIVTATPVDVADGDAAPREATTNGTGTATFEDLAPGTYELSYAETTVPAGTILTTNPTPTVAISYQGTPSASPEFRFVYQAASLAGRVYRNNDQDTTYLSGTDTPGPGLKVWLRADTGGTVPGPKVDSTVTDAEGAYSFGRLAPGPYWVEFENPGTIDYGNLATQRVSLQPAITATRQGRFTGSLVLTIAEARALPLGQRVAVIGNITTPPGSFTSGTGGVNSEIWVQDASGGIAVFSVLTSRAAELALGQRVQVVGTTAVNAGQLQIANPNLTVTAQTGNTIVAPRTVTAAQLNARTYEGQLGRIQGFTVDSIGTTTSTSFNVFGKVEGTPVQVRVIGQSATATNTGLTRANFVPGQTYDVTGELTVFITGTAPNQVVTPQIKPRFASDVVAGAPPIPKIVINEFMANPATTTDPAGEYIELYNAGTTAVDLTGWILLDLSATGTINAADTIGVSTPTPTPLIIQPGGYVLLAHVSTVTTATLVPDYRYKAVGGGIQLNNTGTQPIVLRNPANVTVDSVAYTLATVAGVARGVVDPNADNSNGSVNWVDQTTVYATSGTLTDKGTPKARNDGAVGPSPALTVTYPSASRTVAPARKPKATAAPRR